MLFLDENISYRIVKELSTFFPGTLHITTLLPSGALDWMVWTTAQNKGLTIVSFDADYKDLLNIKGYPPKVIWLRFGNCSNQVLINTLKFYHDKIMAFIANEGLGVLEISFAIQ
jgi:predicted nuclease of predicted toxin-antitoxin system